ncbi:hypothetical protein F4821DRAFT_244176 [Hypoxylon rubiginosum]|uniref:Uncharacterized protein n=1 Tax=Hypoxylon rubiginosum TaxID=110542 RepID=A0ACC0CTI6_9PEZI|nr:hypothetical protein F4821DRAFT_244176 [Hypoxylon rubiginosum]
MLTSCAFPPFDREDRQKLRAYKGAAVATNTLVSCLRPSTNATLEVHDVNFDYPVYSISGDMS